MVPERAHAGRGRQTRLPVLFIVGDPVGGVRRHLHSIFFGLDPAGFTVNYAYSRRRVDPAFERDLRQLLLPAGVRTLTLDVHKRPHPSDLTNLWHLRSFLRETGSRLIHGHGAKGGLYARVLARWTGTPCIYTPHGGSLHASFPTLERLLYSFVERRLAGWTRMAVFESQYSAQRFDLCVGLHRLEWVVNYNGIEPPGRPQLPSPRTAAGPQIGVFAMLRPEKGHPTAFGAFVPVALRWPEARLHIFGIGPEKPRLAKLAKQLGLERQVIWHGEVDRVETRMAEMDLILVPSREESFGYVVVEALAQGIPVIASNVGGIREIATMVEGPLRTVPADDLAAWRVALGDALTVLELGAERRSSLLDPQLSVETMVAKLEAIYAAAAQAPALPAAARRSMAGGH